MVALRDGKLVIDQSNEIEETEYFVQIKTKGTDDTYTVPFSL